MQAEISFIYQYNKIFTTHLYNCHLSDSMMLHEFTTLRANRKDATILCCIHVTDCVLMSGRTKIQFLECSLLDDCQDTGLANYGQLLRLDDLEFVHLPQAERS